METDKRTHKSKENPLTSDFLSEQIEAEYHEGCDQQDFRLFPFHTFTYKDKCMMIRNDSGTTIFADRAFADRVLSGHIDEKTKYFLISRGFAAAPASPVISEPASLILPTFFLIDMTNTCNLACSYCFRVPEHKGRSISSEAVYKICGYIEKHCRKHNIRRISIQPWGGEPLLQLDRIIEICEYFEKVRDISVCLTIETNGTLLTEEVIKKLNNHHVILSISTDGIPAIQDYQRRDRNNAGTSEKVKNACTAVSNSCHYNLGGICVLTDRSLGHIAEILEYSETELHMNGLKMNIMRQPAYPVEGIRALTLDEIADAAKEIVAAMIGIKQRGSSFREMNCEDRIQNLLSRGNGNICHSCGCCGGRRMVSFDMDGNIYPCELTDWPDERLGNISDGEDLCELVARAIAADKPYFRAKEKKECAECPWLYYCRGGCSSHIKYLHLENHGDIVDEAECALNKAMYPLLVKALLAMPQLFEGRQ